MRRARSWPDSAAAPIPSACWRHVIGSHHEHWLAGYHIGLRAADHATPPLRSAAAARHAAGRPRACDRGDQRERRCGPNSWIARRPSLRRDRCTNCWRSSGSASRLPTMSAEVGQTTTVRRIRPVRSERWIQLCCTNAACTAIVTRATGRTWHSSRAEHGAVAGRIPKDRGRACVTRLAVAMVPRCAVLAGATMTGGAR